MRFDHAVLLGVNFLYLCTANPLHAAPGSLCRIDSYESRGFVVCEFDLRQYDLRLFWKKPDGGVYGSLQNIPRDDKPNGGALVFATNGGMYRPDRSPVGLYVENGQTLQAADTGSGGGNFYLKPNGIFFVSGNTAGVLETSRFLRERLHPDSATQSGPMLVIGGRIHPRFLSSGTSEKIRNGVGITDAKKIVFAISNDPVTFAKFAEFFRDRLHCPDALYLDGSISSFYAPSVHRADDLWPLGPIVAVYARD